MSHEVARTPDAAAKVTLGTTIVTAGAIKSGALLANAWARFHARRWLRTHAPHICLGAQTFLRLCDRDVCLIAKELPPQTLPQLKSGFAETKAIIERCFTPATLCEWVSGRLERSPADGVLGALEHGLRDALAPTFAALDTRNASLANLRQRIIQHAHDTVDVDVTPRPGLNIDRRIRRRILLTLLVLAVLFIAAIVGLTIYTLGFTQGLRALGHALHKQIAAMFGHK